MAFICTVPPEEASATLWELYNQDLKARGYIANYTQAFSLHPEVFVAWRGLIKAIRERMDLRRYELITVLAASRLRCTY